MAQERGLTLLGLSGGYGFNVRDDERAAQIKALIDAVHASGSQTINLIPTVYDRKTMPLRDVMREILPMMEGTNVLPRIEPFGFEGCSPRTKAPLAEAIEAVGGTSCFRGVHDTFQHVIVGETEIFPKHTAMVYISGISDPGVTLDAEQDAHRILVNADDRGGNVDQIAAFLEGGYKGVFSFECTEPALIAAPRLDGSCLGTRP